MTLEQKDDKMDNATIIHNIDAKIAGLSIEATIDAFKMAVNTFVDGSDLVVERLMAALESRMDEGAFVALLESI